MCQVNIRMLQHYLYCPHRLWLIEVEKVWAENFFVAKANIDHEAVHCGAHKYSAKHQFVLSNLRVYNDDLNIVGVVDCIEFSESKNGVCVKNKPEKYELSIIEYKPTAPKGSDYRYEDAMQLFAQKCAVDKIFNCNCKTALYYANTKKRISIDFSECYDEFYENLKHAVSGVQNLLNSSEPPKIVYGKKCNGCSLCDICVPKSKKSQKSIKELSLMFE